MSTVAVGLGGDAKSVALVVTVHGDGLGDRDGVAHDHRRTVPLNFQLLTLNCELCSLLLALRLTLQLVKHRTVRAMRAVADALYRIPLPGHFLPKFVHLALQGLWALPPMFLFLLDSCSCCISFINVSFVKEIGICYSFFLVNFSE